MALETKTAPEIDTEHQDMVHDAQLDYYGRRLATCSSDRTVKIFDVRENPNGQEQHTLVKELRSHEGPVWQVAWAHPRFGTMLASCSHDKKVIVWKETESGWEKTKEFNNHKASVNAIAWGPQTAENPLLAAVSSDGYLSVYEMTSQDSWQQSLHMAHKDGAMGISWAPAVTEGALSQVDIFKLRLVTCGCDKLIKIWERDNSKDGWHVKEELKGHTHWVRDVAWMPSTGITNGMIASCGQDGNVCIWMEDGNWSMKTLWNQDRAKHIGPVWRVSWSLTGSILAVSTSENKVTLWKQSLTDEWECVSELTQ